MGAFFLVRRSGSDAPPAEISGLLAQHMTRQGFTDPRTLGGPHFELVVYPKQNHCADNVVEFDNGDFCASVGTLLYRERSGAEALQHYYSDFSPGSPPADNLYGAFCIIIKKNGKLFLLLDRLGIYKAYRNPQGTVWSSSFLANAATLEHPRVNEQAVYEFVFQGATYGNETVFRDVQTVDCDFIYPLDDELQPVAREGAIRDPQPATASMAELVEENLAALRTYYRGIAGCFGDNVDTALSGGYDSRLTLALLKDRGLTPHVHVYGKPDDADVRVAREIDRHEKLGLKHIDKSVFPRLSEDEVAGVVEQNHRVFDGCPTDGIFNNGSDLVTRRQRCASGSLMLNGGGGEVFRNFFYLPDRRYSVQQLLWTFYSQFDPAVTTRRFNEGDYHARLGEKIRAVLGTDRQKLTRTEIELVYPLFRCRYWMGKNNSINNRLGYALTPFIDYSIVKRAISVPLAYKNHGAFEAALIREVSPVLASYPSDYGHDFLGGPGLKHVLADRMTLLRPTRLRRFMYRIKARRLPEERPYLLGNDYLARVMDTDFPCLGELFQVQKNRDNAQYNRMCTLEYLFQKTSAQLV